MARQRPLKLGEIVGNDYVVLDGIKPGDRMIVSGTQFLADGAPGEPADLAAACSLISSSGGRSSPPSARC